MAKDEKSGKSETKSQGLKPWQTEISQEEYLATIKADGTFSGVGFNEKVGKYYKSNASHPEKLKAVAERKARKEARKQIKASRVQRRIDIAVKKATKQAIRDFKASEKFASLIASAKKQGAREAKPHVSAEQRLAKKIAKQKALEAEIAKLKTATKSA